MKLARDLSAIEIKKIQNLILFGGVFVTLAIWTKLEDPINLPKMFVLAMFSAIVLGLSAPAIINIRKLISRSQINGLILVALFVLGLFISTLATDVKYTAIFGEYHRNNGALSYFGAAIFLACSILVFNIESVSRFLFSFANLGLVVSTYGFLQVLGLDPVNWVIVYNPVITTLGNPNFTSGILGLTAIATFLLILENRNPKIKIFYSLALLLELFVLIKSNSVQGGFALLAGISIVILTKIWSLNRKVGIVAFVFSGLIGLFVALGVFNAGPLASRLSQNSLGNRLDYWNAAISMFKSHP